MANLNSTAVWEVRPATGSDSNGGMFNAAGSGAGTDYSQQNSPQLSLTDVVTNGTTTVTSATGGFTAAMARNGINIAGTVYEIASVTNGNTIVVVGSPASASGQTGNVGGALASDGYMLSQAVTGGNKAYSPAGTRTITSASQNVSNGCLKFDLDSFEYYVYTGSRGTPGTATLQASGISSATLITITGGRASGSRVLIFGLGVDGQNLSTMTGVSFTGASCRSTYQGATVKNCTTGISQSASQIQNLLDVEITGCTTGLSYAASQASGCVNLNIHDNTTGVTLSQDPGIELVRSQVCHNSGTGISAPSSNCVRLESCTVADNGTGLSIAFFANTGRESSLRNTIFYGNATDISATSPDGIGLPIISCAAPAGVLTSTISGYLQNNVTLTTRPFVGAAGSGNYALNSTAGGGAACKGAGTPANLDIGAVQSASGGPSLPPMIGSPLIRAVAAGRND